MASGFSALDILNQKSKEGMSQEPGGRFRTKDVSIHKMYPSELNFYSTADIEELAGEILAAGLKQNLEIVYDPCEKGDYRIIAGERRWKALKHLVEQGYEKFEIATCKLTDPQDADEEQVEIIIANSYREKTAADMLEEAKRMKESMERMKAAGKKLKGFDLQSGRLRPIVAAMLKISETKLAQIESINNNLIPELREELKEGSLTFSAAYEISGMPAEKQQAALEQYKESGKLTFTEAKEMKEDLESRKNVSQSDTEEVDTEETEENVLQEAAGVMNPTEYVDPSPEKMYSLCFSCEHWYDCQEKGETVTACNEYASKNNITEEQKYEEDQKRIDRETAKRLQEMEREKKLEDGPERKEHQIRMPAAAEDDIRNGKRPFEILKNDGYRQGDEVEMIFFRDGRNTGETLKTKIAYLIDDHTGLTDGYCVAAFEVL